MEKSKHTVQIQPEAARRHNVALPIILIGIGVLFLLVNTGIFSFSDIGTFFGTVGRFFGEIGGSIGRFFGSLGGSLGSYFGNLGGLIGRLWPLLLIVIGALLLIRRGGEKAKNAPYEDR